MPSQPNRRFAVALRIEGEEDKSFYRCIDSITVTEDLDQGASFQIRLTALRDAEGAYPHLDDERLRPWNRMTIAVAFPEREEDVIMDGYISHLHPVAGSRSQVTLDIRGVDASYTMNLEEKRKVWREKTYEQIAGEILEQYRLRPHVQEASGSDEAQPPAVTQRATDHRFLRELARRKGYEFFVRGGDAYFRLPELSGEPQGVIAVNFGAETNVDELEIELDGTRPTQAVMTRVDPTSGQTQTVTAGSSDLEGVGRTDLSELRGFGAPQTSVVVRRQPALSETQMTQYVQGLLRRHGWWVRASGKLNGVRYGGPLRSKRLVTIKGLGRSFNGKYYVHKVVHKLTARTYLMEFEAGRNRLEQDGTEDFSIRHAGGDAVPFAAGGGADAEVTRVAAGTQVTFA